MAIIKHPEQRVGVFIDTQNLYHTAKNLYRARVNFGNVLKDSVAGRRLIRARAYMVTTESGEETAFLDALTKMGIEPKTKDLQIFYGGAKKADWDVGMAVDAIVASQKLDTVILFTGDGDFVPLVHYLKEHGCQVEVTSFGRSTSGKLKDAADQFLDLDEDPRRYLINYRPVRGRRFPPKENGVGSLPSETQDKLGEIERATDVE
ncbi:MAG: NYN domain-containing protein [Candidatus Kaiserbacteria bacterium]|nr:MAG: NYN domain-containing protein [Candidatus Kaiserbacteria bacterium]